MSSAAWVVYKAVDNSVHFTKGYASKYYFDNSGSSDWENIAGWNSLGLYDMIVTLGWIGWSALIIVLSFVFTSQVWEMIAAREVGVKTEG